MADIKTLKSKYTINVNSAKLLSEIKEKFKDKKNNTFPVPKVVISKGNFVITTFTFSIKSFEDDNSALISIIKEDTRGNKNAYVDSINHKIEYELLSGDIFS